MSAATILEWNDQLATGLASVDSQHQRLVAIINELGVLHTKKATAEEIAPALKALRDYTVYHFEHEEELMKVWPVNEAHKAIHIKSHQGFVKCIDRTAEMAADNPADVVDHLLSFLVKWLVHHINGEDMRMVKEIMTLQSGASIDQAGSAGNPLHDALITTVSDLYDSLGQRTFEILQLNRELQAYHDQGEEENALAQEIILRLMQHGGLSSSQLHYWFSPATTFSGDIIAAIHGPEDQFYVLLADAMGHGLAAAITVLPVMSVFHARAERGRPLRDIVAEINRNLRATLPPGRFIAATLLCINSANKTAEAWIGGMPAIQLLDAGGCVLKTLSSSHFPLGITDFNADMADTTQISWEDGNQFLMYSDGLIEAANPAGESFGEKRLERALQGASAAQRLAAVQSALASHIGSSVPHDDISLALIDCRQA
ncbi:MAG: bacteriohemerythrin [Gallionellaceae bacterium]|nr:bacteriohemerythrin [Gallionellaceae bacterium]